LVCPNEVYGSSLFKFRAFSPFVSREERPINQWGLWPALQVRA
jgi:hypothetical protein